MSELFKIEVNDISKRFGYQWILKNINLEFENNTIYSIAGANGSGKSTFIKILSGYLSPSSGKINFRSGTEIMTVSDIYKHINLVAPYTDLINEFTLKEMFEFHKKFKQMATDMTYQKFIHIIELPDQKDKPLGAFSSGMKQKIQLALALLSETSVLLLDEPTSFLDEQAKIWFANLLTSSSNNRLIVIASNDNFDLSLATIHFNVDTTHKTIVSS